MSEFWAMGGYAAYVWSSYAIAFVVLSLAWIFPLRQQRQIKQRLRGKYRREARQHNNKE